MVLMLNSLCEAIPDEMAAIAFLQQRNLILRLKVTVGVGLIWNGKYNINKDKHMHMANRVNNYTVIGIFIITVLNVFISAFGMPGQEEFSPLVESIDLNNITKPLR